MASVYHIVAIRVNEISCAHVWRLHFRYLGMRYDNYVKACLRFLYNGRRAILNASPISAIVAPADNKIGDACPYSASQINF
jgi:hypothetical protein